MEQKKQEHFPITNSDTTSPISMQTQEIKLYQPLNALPFNKKANIADLQIEGDMRRRLLDLGFTLGAEIQCLYRSPFGDPTAYFIRGAVIALRQEDAKQIIVSF